MLKNIKGSLLFFLLLCFSAGVQAQVHKQLSAAAMKSDFKKVEQIVKQEINKYNKKRFRSYDAHLDSFTVWLLRQPCVADAAWDKCQTKIDIYPGFATVGAQFKTNKGIVEKVFRFQLGQLRSGGKSNDIIIFKKMDNGSGFVQQQRELCMETISLNDVSVPVSAVKGKWESLDGNKKMIEFRDTVAGDLYIRYGQDYYFKKDTIGGIRSLGVHIAWPPVYCRMEKPDNDTLILYFSSSGNTSTIRFRRIR